MAQSPRDLDVGLVVIIHDGLAFMFLFLMIPGIVFNDLTGV